MEAIVLHVKDSHQVCLDNGVIYCTFVWIIESYIALSEFLPLSLWNSMCQESAIECKKGTLQMALLLLCGDQFDLESFWTSHHPKPQTSNYLNDMRINITKQRLGEDSTPPCRETTKVTHTFPRYSHMIRGLHLLDVPLIYTGFSDGPDSWYLSLPRGWALAEWRAPLQRDIGNTLGGQKQFDKHARKSECMHSPEWSQLLFRFRYQTTCRAKFLIILFHANVHFYSWI